MSRKIGIAVIIAFTLVVCWGRVDEDVCGWTSWNLKKRITDDWSWHFRNEYWFRDRARDLDQDFFRIWTMYRVFPCFSLGPGYEYLEQHTAENAALDYYKRRNDFFAQGILTWSLGDFRFALRERYTYARECVNPRNVHGDKRPSKNRELNSDFLRTRLHVRYVIDKDCPVTPFVYEEIFCWDWITQTRSAIGVNYKINDSMSFDLLYLRQSKYKPGHRNNNVISLDFNYSF